MRCGIACNKKLFVVHEEARELHSVSVRRKIEPGRIAESIRMSIHRGADMSIFNHYRDRYVATQEEEYSIRAAQRGDGR